MSQDLAATLAAKRGSLPVNKAADGQPISTMPSPIPSPSKPPTLAEESKGKVEGKECYFTMTFPTLTFHCKGAKILADKRGVYTPANEIQKEFLDLQVSRGILTKKVM